ncbi:hypothetical protein L1987_38698 [Smallanthus sonchifolius]|uniref:Uncharacterized protein n=1 Tax=Smallanthus sonchifolius TaxID=185202 RepID=A0ACB9HK84_9ASTR|nr:hypothetical protein L1987_38698 [Smallanthus sonchifolius]
MKGNAKVKFKPPPPPSPPPSSSPRSVKINNHAINNGEFTNFQLILSLLRGFQRQFFKLLLMPALLSPTTTTSPIYRSTDTRLPRFSQYTVQKANPNPRAPKAVDF